jgi:hypothetical protein
LPSISISIECLHDRNELPIDGSIHYIRQNRRQVKFCIIIRVRRVAILWHLTKAFCHASIPVVERSNRVLT